MARGSLRTRIGVLCTTKYVRKREHGNAERATKAASSVIASPLTWRKTDSSTLCIQGKDRPLYLKGELYADFSDDSSLDRQVGGTACGR